MDASGRQAHPYPGASSLAHSHLFLRSKHVGVACPQNSHSPVCVVVGLFPYAIIWTFSELRERRGGKGM